MLPQKSPPRDSTAKDVEKSVKVDGFQQIVDMLCVADDAFRESLLGRIEMRDFRLAQMLRGRLTGRMR